MILADVIIGLLIFILGLSGIVFVIKLVWCIVAGLFMFCVKYLWPFALIAFLAFLIGG